MYRLIFAVFLALQLLLVLLDIWQLRRQGRDGNENAEPLRRGTVLFLLAVTAVFLCVQLAGGYFTPQPLEILDAARRLTSAWTGAAAAAPLSDGMALLLGAGLFYVAGFWDYLVHRCFSHSRWFWMTHEYHHLPRQVSILMPGILARPFGFLPVAISTFATAASVYGLLWAGGLPLWDLRPLLPTLLVISLVLTASHSCFLRRFSLVHRAMRTLALTTPQEHLLHHGVESRGNYGNFTTLWDRVFGTYVDPQGVRLDDVPLGLSYDQDFLGTLTIGRVRLSSAQREKYQVARFCNLQETSGAS